MNQSTDGMMIPITAINQIPTADDRGGLSDFSRGEILAVRCAEKLRDPVQWHSLKKKKKLKKEEKLNTF